VNESRFALATNQLISALWKQWPVDGQDGGLKTVRNVCLSARPCCSSAHKQELIVLETRDPRCRSGGRKSNVYPDDLHHQYVRPLPGLRDLACPVWFLGRALCPESPDTIV